MGTRLPAALPLPLATLLLLCTASSFAALLHLGRNLTASANNRLTRAPEAKTLESYIDSRTDLGVCYHGIALVPGCPEHVCRPLHCLYSKAAGAYIDLDSNILQPLGSGNHFKCNEPLGGQLPLQEADPPTISFIIPFLNNPGSTSACLMELFRTAREVDSAEYILIDDGSDDTDMLQDMVDKLVQYFGITVKQHRFNERKGFGVSVNQGVSMSSGHYLAIINNDAYVMKGWLWTIMSTFALRNPRPAGLVGPLFMGHNNLVQEGGGWMFKDATGGNYGKNAPLSSDVNYLREVDYVSAAAIVVLAELVENFGLLDESYVNGYFEDTDLAMRVTSKGYRVLLQPLAVVFHQEGATFGTDTSKWKQELMSKNRQVFIERWSHQLEEQHCPPETEWATAVRRKAYPRILWVDDKILEPDRDSGSIRTFNLLRALIEEGFDVTYQAINLMHNRSEYYAPLMRYHGIDTPNVLPPSMWQLIDSNGNCKYNVIVVARRYIYQPAISFIKQDCPCSPLIYDTVDLHFLREARAAITQQSHDRDVWDFQSLSATKINSWLEGKGKAQKTVAMSRDLELALMDVSDVVVVVSHVEAQVVKYFRPEAKVTIISNTHDLPKEDPPVPNDCEQRSGALFIGSFNHPPNRQAIVTFIDDLLPRVLDLLPKPYRRDFKFNIIGSDDVPRDLISMFDRNKQYVRFHGYVPEDQVQGMFQATKVFVAPLLSGAGVKGKVNQAMKYGLPVVGTPIAFEAMFPRDGEDCMVATDPDEFAKKVVQVYTDCRLWSKLVAGGYINLRKNFGLDLARKSLLETLDLVGIRPRRGPATCAAVDDD